MFVHGRKLSARALAQEDGSDRTVTQGLGNQRIGDRGDDPPAGDGQVVADERLGGLLRSYRHSA